jgi:GT2 family glycosyltransferase
VRPNTAIAIINFHTAQETAALVHALHDEYPEVPIVVVDNASSGDDLEVLGRNTPPIKKLIAAASNGGYGAGANIALKWAAANSIRLLWLLNPDTKPQPGALTSLTHHFGTSAIATSAQYSGTTTSPEYYICAARRRNSVERPFICSGCKENYHPVSIVSGASLLLDVGAVLHVGGFDEQYFHYKEEYDLVSRLVSQGGQARLVCASKVWHHRGGSLSTRSPSALYYRVRNEILFLRKEREVLSFFGVLKHPRLLAASFLWTLTAWRGGAPLSETVRSLAAAYRDGIKGVGGPRTSQKAFSS